MSFTGKYEVDRTEDYDHVGMRIRSIMLMVHIIYRDHKINAMTRGAPSWFQIYVESKSCGSQDLIGIKIMWNLFGFKFCRIEIDGSKTVVRACHNNYNHIIN